MDDLADSILASIGVVISVNNLADCLEMAPSRRQVQDTSAQWTRTARRHTTYDGCKAELLAKTPNSRLGMGCLPPCTHVCHGRSPRHSMQFVPGSRDTARKFFCSVIEMDMDAVLDAA